ncbi:MAG: hypothetical protein CMJ31_12260 [Phycisphaerae bacterium]|nr:hypothetical protein [Phycisphaerae bacterium]
MSAIAVAMCGGLASAQFGTETVNNGTFESGSVFLNMPTNWATLGNPGGLWTNAFNHTPGGSRSISIDIMNGFHAWEPVLEFQSEIVPPAPTSNGGPVTFSFWYLMDGEVTNTAVVGAKIDWFSATGSRIGGTPDLDVETRDTMGEWQQFTTEVMPPVGTTRARILLFTFAADTSDPAADGVVYYDDVSLIQAMGEGTCSEADLAEPFGLLDAADLMQFVGNAISDQVLLTVDDNRIGNSSFEMGEDDPMDDPDEGFTPTDWFSFNFDPGSNFYAEAGVNGAPMARTGDFMVRVADDGPAGGFHGWAPDPIAAAPYNLTNPLVLRGWFNIPAQMTAQVIGVKVEFPEVTEEGTYGPNRGSTGDIFLSTTGAPTNGWEEFVVTLQPEELPATGDVARPLVFLFQGGAMPIVGDIYFDDITIGQNDSRQADINEDETTDAFDVIEFLGLYNMGCPGA